MPATTLGATGFGQSGSLEEVYRHHGLDTDSLVEAALDLLPASAYVGLDAHVVVMTKRPRVSARPVETWRSAQLRAAIRRPRPDHGV